MGKQKATTIRSNHKRLERDLLKRPRGMSKRDFKYLAPIMALDIKARKQSLQNSKPEFKKKYR